MKLFILLLLSTSVWAQDLQTRLKYLTPSPYLGDASLHFLRETKGCGIFSLSFNVTDTLSKKIFPFEMTLTWPRSNKPAPVIVIIPSIEGITPVEKSIAMQLCEKKVAAVIAHVNNGGFDKKNFDQQLYRSAVTIRTLVDVLEKSPSAEGTRSIERLLLDTKRIGLVALSAGSAAALLAMSVENRFKGLFVMGAIGDIPLAMAESNNAMIRKIRNEQMQKLNFTNTEQYQNYLRQKITANPMNFASLLRQKNIYQVIIPNDSIAPTAGQIELARALDNRKTFIDHSGLEHAPAIVNEVLISKKHLMNFLKTEVL